MTGHNLSPLHHLGLTDCFPRKCNGWRFLSLAAEKPLPEFVQASYPSLGCGEHLLRTVWVHQGGISVYLFYSEGERRDWESSAGPDAAQLPLEIILMKES